MKKRKYYGCQREGKTNTSKRGEIECAETDEVLQVKEEPEKKREKKEVGRVGATRYIGTAASGTTIQRRDQAQPDPVRDHRTVPSLLTSAAVVVAVAATAECACQWER